MEAFMRLKMWMDPAMPGKGMRILLLCASAMVLPDHAAAAMQHASLVR